MTLQNCKLHLEGEAETILGQQTRLAQAFAQCAVYEGDA